MHHVPQPDRPRQRWHGGKPLALALCFALAVKLNVGYTLSHHASMQV